jgi:hypothetical protein
MPRPRPFFALWCAALATVALLALSEPARGDLFVLESGGRVEGEWLNREEQPLRVYLVRTPAGLTISLPQDQVREAVRHSAADAEYHRRAPSVPDTIEAQWALAEWCRSQGLTSERRTHLERIIQLDPNHQRARGALGYQYLQGQWITRSEFRRQEGYEYYQGRWRTPQEIEILEARGRTELAQKDWLVKLRRWRKDLAIADKSAAAYDQIAAIKDPVAIGPLGTALRGERDRRVKMLYADVLANINTGEAVGVLVDRTLSDPDEELFHYCLDKLVQLQPPHVLSRSNHHGRRPKKQGDTGAKPLECPRQQNRLPFQRTAKSVRQIHNISHQEMGHQAKRRVETWVCHFGSNANQFPS